MKLPRPYILACSLPLSLFAAEWTKHVIQPAEGAKGGINTANAADFNRDGKLDVIASHSGAVRGSWFSSELCIGCCSG